MKSYKLNYCVKALCSYKNILGHYFKGPKLQKLQDLRLHGRVYSVLYQIYKLEKRLTKLP